MKVVIITAEDAKKTELSGAEKLSKSDLLIMLSTKNKTDLPAAVKEALDGVKAETAYVKLDSASENAAAYAYYAGYHEGKGHQTYIVATDKDKVPDVISNDVKVYTSFASVVKSDSTSSSKSSSTKRSTKKTSTKKSSSSSTTSKTAQSALTETISSITGLSKSDTKKLINAASEMISKKQ